MYKQNKNVLKITKQNEQKYIKCAPIQGLLPLKEPRQSRMDAHSEFAIN